MTSHAAQLLHDCTGAAAGAGITGLDKLANRLLFEFRSDETVGAVIACEFLAHNSLAAVTRDRVIFVGPYKRETFDPKEWMYLRSMTGAHLFDEIPRGSRVVLNPISALKRLQQVQWDEFGHFCSRIFPKSDK